MSVFNLKTALLALGRNNSPIDSLGIAYGVPECLLSLTKDALNLLPSPILKTINESLQEGRDSAHERVAALKKKLLLENGIFEIDTENGTFKFMSDSSRNKLDKNSEKKSSTVGDFLTALGAAATAGAELYTNYVDTVSVLMGVKDCVDSYKRFLDYHKDKTLPANYASEIAQAQDAEDFIALADQTLADIIDILVARTLDSSLEPSFTDGLIPVSSVLQTASATAVTEAPVFRLVFGPPKSKSGQFLFSVDGLYYDSQKGGLPSVSGVVPNADYYNFNFAANLGGKGQAVSNKDLNQYVDTIFDLNVIDDSIELQKHYDADHFLQVLYGQKYRHIYNLSGVLNTLYTSGYTEDSAMAVNTKQQIYSVATQHNVKINKRKKQIEVAVKTPYIFGKGKIFNFGEIPINDFSFLANINLNVAYESQKKLVFKQGEVSGVVLPLQPKFVKASEAESVATFNHLIIPPVGVGSIIFETSGSQSNNILSLTDSIVTDGLIAVYNFLESDVTTPGSNDYTVLNCAAKTNHDKAAQLVSLQASSVFVSGLGIPYIEGMTQLNANTGLPSSVGSYIQLPNIQEYQNLLYNPNGMTFESWVYMPQLTTSSTAFKQGNRWGVSSFHRVLLACENTGGDNDNISVGSVEVDYGTGHVRGLTCGFTRDAQIVSNLIPNDLSSANPVTASGIYFYLAPTRSFNGSDIGFIRDTVNVECASPIYQVFGAKIPITTIVNGKNFGQASATFCQIAVTVEPISNSVKFYCDGVLMLTSGIDQVFGVQPYQTPKIPNFIQSNSFSYATSSTGLSVFANGPTVSSFTPWIIGGGFSDGYTNGGGFMGLNSGRESGLKGYVGSVKFYSKALTNTEVLYNYTNQSGFFKQILI